MVLPPGFLARPLAHRGLHDRAFGRPENSRAAVVAAVAAGYGIEIDLQLSADGRAMVFHDDMLDRLTEATGPIRERGARELAGIMLRGASEGVPEFGGILRLVAGRVPLLVEIKEQGAGPESEVLARAAAQAAAGYDGPLAFMSFDPQAMIALGTRAPGVTRGLTTCAFSAADWPDLPPRTRARRAGIVDLEAAGASFISHDRRALHMPRVSAIRAAGLPVLCWTIRSPAEEAEARRLADNVTFEGYLPA